MQPMSHRRSSNSSSDIIKKLGLGFAMGGIVGGTFGAIMGVFSGLNAGYRGGQLARLVGKMSLQSGGLFGGFMAIGSVLRGETKQQNLLVHKQHQYQYQHQHNQKYQKN